MKRSSRRICTGLLSLAVILSIHLFVLPTSVLAVDYDLTTIDASSDGYTYLYGINNLGKVVGVSVNSGRTDEYGFSYSAGSYTTMDYPGALQTEANGINDLGQIVGLYFPGPYGFLYSDGNYTTINYPGAIQTEPYGINDLGQIVGSYKDTNGNFHGFLYSGGSYTTMDYPGAAFTYIFGTNNAGQIVGWYIDTGGNNHGFSYSAGRYTTMDYPGATFTKARGINNAGKIVGWYSFVSGEAHGFLYSGGSYTTMDYPGASITEPCGINDQGQIVGWYGISRHHGFLATPYPVPIDIDIKPDRINPKSKGKIEVAILSTNEFNAPEMVDIESLTFGRTGAEDSLAFCARKIKDFDKDGSKDDLVCHFYTQDTGFQFQCGDTEGILQGKKKDGTLIQGSDSVNIVPCK